MNLNALNNRVAARGGSTETMPVLFVGHGNPMNAISENEFSNGWKEIGKTLPKPASILCISAHWETNGTYVTAMARPKTIHDFGGFPKALYDVQYPAPGDPGLAEETTHIVSKTPLGLDSEWGLDHGCWSVIMHMFPKADVPVVEMSLDYSKPPRWHYELAKELSSLRKKGILIIGSGNIVHNLGMMDWDGDSGFDWAIAANELLKQCMVRNDFQKLINYRTQGKEIQLAVPTPEHYLPLLYVLGLKDEREGISFFNDKTVSGSISMTSLKIDKV